MVKKSNKLRDREYVEERLRTIPAELASAIGVRMALRSVPFFWSDNVDELNSSGWDQESVHRALCLSLLTLYAHEEEKTRAVKSEFMREVAALADKYAGFAISDHPIHFAPAPLSTAYFACHATSDIVMRRGESTLRLASISIANSASAIFEIDPDMESLLWDSFENDIGLATKNVRLQEMLNRPLWSVPERVLKRAERVFRDTDELGAIHRLMITNPPNLPALLETLPFEPQQLFEFLHPDIDLGSSYAELGARNILGAVMVGNVPVEQLTEVRRIDIDLKNSPGWSRSISNLWEAWYRSETDRVWEW